MNSEHPLGPPMTLGNMRQQGVRGLAVYCLNHACRHHAVLNVDDWPHEVEVPSFGRRMKCSKCAGTRERAAELEERPRAYSAAYGNTDRARIPAPYFVH